MELVPPVSVSEFVNDALAPTLETLSTPAVLPELEDQPEVDWYGDFSTIILFMTSNYYQDTLLGKLKEKLFNKVN